ncbi:unnamed protein product [Vitrella brassicaformis CCMP3155]|uniref:pyridoxal kinase n=1 Tax=Vitrella brassicaformis (strain CCMP3155) TaxID=1169540 RepID=A0A0G4F809_VITBC|nr:unnamed protein product [Vitrella brassicaformis CCMP3155]|eukprot:CEM08853.1 unnamed protein product [Vitrella brassicaformis CCMP3155]
MSSAYRQGSTQDISQARILSVQSHVVNGYVGNKAAIFPLQLLGNDVDFINSVQFVSQFVHQGQKLSGEELRTLLDGLQKHNLGNYQYFLTGFIGQPSFLREVLAFIKSQKANPPLSLSPSPSAPIWLCDPVLGDNGKLYTDEALIDIYRTEVLPATDIITPNQWELRWLTGLPADTLDDLINCFQHLHVNGPRIIVATSAAITTPQCEGDQGGGMVPSSLYLVASEYRGAGDDAALEHGADGRRRVRRGDMECWSLKFPNLDLAYYGQGDLTAALLLANYHKYRRNLARTIEVTLAAVQGVIERTLRLGDDRVNLDITGSQAEILNPTVVHKAERIPT